ncbi:uncharacterized protein LOC129915166 [Episyrphus balteatus]|uniref:uncharacterized protein LOC129915166 n=1 Tax=Episyrphus balteatus TaxID=286459 RepID=UPI002486B257|nr:uncharacterized protein LOC129915166 [Episyrphus balteatus]
MAIDFLILGLILISFTINLLALGAFWVTPGLRTTTNRFLINLLIINLVSCCILAATLIFIEDQDTVLSNIESLEIITKNSTSDYYKFKDFKDIENESAIGGHSDEEDMVESNQLMRLWSIDMAAALGALSVLLVVGDTWMAVRDPLHYHRRVSRVKAWVLITTTWTLGIFFGMISAYRQIYFECIKIIENNRNMLFEEIEEWTLTEGTILNMIFSCIYFVLIILLPFGFICGMYWRIFSEAKDNGVKKLKKRSSPILQQQILSKFKETTSLDDINKSPFQPLLVRSSDRLNAIRQIYSDPNFQRFNQGHSNFVTGFEPTSNLRYMAHQALQIPTTHTSQRSFNYMVSVFKHREESRAARISILVVIMFIVSYLPYGFLVLLQDGQIIENFQYATQLAVFLILLGNLTSPIIFAYRNKRIRHGINRLFGLDIRSRIYRQRDKCGTLHSGTKVSTSLKRNRRKLYSYSKNTCKYLEPILKNPPKSLQNIKYDTNKVGTYLYLTNSATVQSSVIFGHISVVST